MQDVGRHNLHQYNNKPYLMWASTNIFITFLLVRTVQGARNKDKTERTVDDECKAKGLLLLFIWGLCVCVYVHFEMSLCKINKRCMNAWTPAWFSVGLFVGLLILSGKSFISTNLLILHCASPKIQRIWIFEWTLHAWVPHLYRVSQSCVSPLNLCMHILSSGLKSP